jgi:hypothetical protein
MESDCGRCAGSDYKKQRRWRQSVMVRRPEFWTKDGVAHEQQEGDYCEQEEEGRPWDHCGEEHRGERKETRDSYL